MLESYLESFKVDIVVDSMNASIELESYLESFKGWSLAQKPIPIPS